MECTPSHSYGMSLAIWDHTVLPATRHRWTHPAFIPAKQAGTRFIYTGGMEGWVDLGDLLHTEMVYPTREEKKEFDNQQWAAENHCKHFWYL